MDDGSTDDSSHIAERWGVNVLRHETNRGLSAARNTGIKKAAGNLIASLDADCVAHPDWLEKLEECLNEKAIVGAGGKLIERNSETVPDLWRTIHMRQHWGNRFLTNPQFLFGNNNLFRKSALEEVGMYNEILRTNFEDVSMSENLLTSGYRIVYQPLAVVEHLRTDTILSAVRTHWKWHFFGYRQEITFRNTVREFGWRIREQVPGMFLRDYRYGGILSAILTCAAVTYGIYLDFNYLFTHYGEKPPHQINKSNCSALSAPGDCESVADE